MDPMKNAAPILCLVILFVLSACSGSGSDGDDDVGGTQTVPALDQPGANSPPVSSVDGGEGIIGADGIRGHPTADLIGTWVFRSVTVDQMPAELSSQLEFREGAVEARVHIHENSAYVYEEVDFRGGQLWAEWGFIYFNENELDVNQQFDTAGPQQDMIVFDYILQDGVLFLADDSDGELLVFVLTM